MSRSTIYELINRDMRRLSGFKEFLRNLGLGALLAGNRQLEQLLPAGRRRRFRV